MPIWCSAIRPPLKPHNAKLTSFDYLDMTAMSFNVPPDSSLRFLLHISPQRVEALYHQGSILIRLDKAGFQYFIPQNKIWSN